MQKIYYITSNKYKLEHAVATAVPFGLDIVGHELDIPEIQSNSIREVVLHKAKQAWDVLGKPLVVSDSGWEIPALGGFPGPYMHDINSWFAVEDFINLMRDKQDKSIYLNHLVTAVKDGNPELFPQRIRGVFIEEPQGEGSALDRIVILDGANGTIAQNQAKGLSSTDDSLLWKDVADYFCF